MFRYKQNVIFFRIGKVLVVVFHVNMRDQIRV